MSDDNASGQVQASADDTGKATEAAGTDAETTDTRNDGLGETGLKALHAERDARKAAEAASKELAEKLAAYEDRDKTDQQKAEDRIARLTAELDARDAALAAAEMAVLRNEVAVAKGLPPELALRLQGEDRKSLEKDADALLSLVNPAKPDARSPKPVNALGGSQANLSSKEQFAALMENYL